MLVHWDSHMPALAPLYDGPYDVLRGSLHTFIIQMGEREEVVSTSRLKPCGTPNVAPTLPRKCSWPLRSAGQSGLPPHFPPDPLHPQHIHMLVGEWSHMVGLSLGPHAGVGQVGFQSLVPLHLHFPRWRHFLLLHFPQWRHFLLLHFPLWRHFLLLHFPQWRHFPQHLHLVQLLSCVSVPRRLASNPSTSASAWCLGHSHMLCSCCHHWQFQQCLLLVPFSLVPLPGFLQAQERTPQPPISLHMSTSLPVI